MILEQLAAPESEEVLQNTHNSGGMSKGHSSQPKCSQWSKLEQFEQENTVGLNYNPKYNRSLSPNWYDLIIKGERIGKSHVQKNSK